MSGILTKSRLALADYPEIVSVLARLAGDEEANKRPSLSAAKSKLDQGGQVAGVRALGRHLGPDLANTVLGLIAPKPSKQNNAELPPIDGGEDAFDLKRHLISAKIWPWQIFPTGNSSLSHGSHIARFRCCMRPVVLAKLGWQHQLRLALLMAMTFFTSNLVVQEKCYSLMGK